MIIFNHKYEHITSLENLLEAWQEFVRGKRSRLDVQEFERNLMSNIITLNIELKNKTYTHLPYEAFNVSDPKPRNIHKATVSDRLLHHAVYRMLYPFFDRTFIAHSYSCRLNKGTHKALNTFRVFAYKVSKNHRKTVWVLKCDIKRFFASIDHKILKNILAKYIKDEDILWLLGRVIDSFHTEGKSGVGLPLGNLTSQLWVNIYMNKFDQWMKHRIKAKYYIRYADDFVILSRNKDWLLELTPRIAGFLEGELKLTLHPDKVFIKTFASSVDFLGWIHFPHHKTLRTSTQRRMLKKVCISHTRRKCLPSYLGMLKHGNTFKLRSSSLFQINNDNV